MSYELARIFHYPLPNADEVASSKKERTMFGHDIGIIMAIEKKCVLIVDDYDQITRLMKWALRSSFERVFSASDPAAATRILENHDVTHLLCDYCLGVGGGPAGVSGFTFVEFWRREFPGIERAVIFTGADIERLKKPVEVDAMVSKAEGMDAVIAALMEREKP